MEKKWNLDLGLKIQMYIQGVPKKVCSTFYWHQNWTRDKSSFKTFKIFSLQCAQKLPSLKKKCMRKMRSNMPNTHSTRQSILCSDSMTKYVLL